MSPDFPVLIFVALVALLWSAHRIDRWMSRRRARAYLDVQRRDRADALREAELKRVREQRDRYLALYNIAVKRNAALLEHIGDEREAAAVQALANEKTMSWLRPIVEDAQERFAAALEVADR